MQRIIINGASGRMGRAVAEAALESPDFRVVGGVAPGSSSGVEGWPDAECAKSIDGIQGAFDLVLDFSSPEGAAAAAGTAARKGVPLVTGTTGLSGEGREALERASESVPVVAAANFSVGVTLLLDLVERAVRSAGPDADVEILEAHHRFKADAPSGTALRLGEAVAAVRGEPLEKLARFDRRSEAGPRGAGSIGFASLRGGDIIGEHQVLLAMAGERLELGHRATDRGIFARGALRAAGWAAGRKPGLYGMHDVLDLSG